MEMNNIKSYLLTLSLRLKNDMERLTDYSKQLGYDIDFSENFNSIFYKNVCDSFPVLRHLNYYHSLNMIKKFKLNNYNNLLDESDYFIMGNFELYFVNKIHNLIENVSDKNKTIKFSSETEYVNNFVSYLISEMNMQIIKDRQKNGKIVLKINDNDFVRVKRILMYSNESTNTVLSELTENNCKGFFDSSKTYSDLFQLIGYNDSYYLINLYLVDNKIKELNK